MDEWVGVSARCSHPPIGNCVICIISAMLSESESASLSEFESLHTATVRCSSSAVRCSACEEPAHTPSSDAGCALRPQDLVWVSARYQVSSVQRERALPCLAPPLLTRSHTLGTPRRTRPIVHGVAILVSAHRSEYTVSQATACARIDLTLTLTWDRHGDLVSMFVFMFVVVFMFPHVKIRPGALGAFPLPSPSARSTEHTAHGTRHAA